MLVFKSASVRLLLAGLLLVILAGCASSATTVNDYIPSDFVSTLECQTRTAYESAEHLGCMERVFNDIPRTQGFDGKCVAVELGGYNHAWKVIALLKSLSDGSASCRVQFLEGYGRQGLWLPVREVGNKGFISFAFAPVIAPNAEVKGVIEREDWKVIAEPMLKTGTCFLFAMQNKGDKDLISVLSYNFNWHGEIDTAYLNQILLDPETCVVLVTRQNTNATRRYAGAGICEGFEPICLHTKGFFALKSEHRVEGTSFSATYLLATLNKVYERMPLGTKPKEVVDMALQCVYGFGKNFTPTPGERLDLWCLREKLLQARARQTTSG